MAHTHACPDCLRRSWLLELLSPYLERERTVTHNFDFLRLPQLLSMGTEDLASAAAPEVAMHLIARVQAIPEQEMHDRLREADCWACCRHSEIYPAALRDAADAPWALIGRGDPGLLEELEPSGTVAIVGTRRATSYGQEIARELGRELAAEGVVVVSGLAFGIDSCVHSGALDSGRTVAVTGCGPDVVYPAKQRSLWRQICQKGLVVSELPPGALPRRWTSPARSRIMAALAGMTVVVEAANQSGSLITADFAAFFGREIGSVPGPVTSRASAGPNGLLAAGASVVRDAQDILEVIDVCSAKAIGCSDRWRSTSE